MDKRVSFENLEALTAGRSDLHKKLPLAALRNDETPQNFLNERLYTIGLCLRAALQRKDHCQNLKLAVGFGPFASLFHLKARKRS